MTNKMLFRLGASTLVLTAAIGCAPVTSGSQVGPVAQAPVAERDPNKLAALAQAAVQVGRLAEAVDYAERTVELAPQDAGHRLLLGDLYLKSGRFASAETSFSDVLTLDPGSVRGALSLALAMIAQGKTMLATAELDRIAGSASPSDLGLAYALAGDTNRAIGLLEPAARSSQADGRVRQNLALAYAIAGEWGKARLIAAQDVSPAELAGRLASWAELANPGEPGVRVARLFGAQPVADAGQPLRLALSTEVLDESQFAAVAQPVAPLATPVQVAELAPTPKPVEVAGYPAPLAAPVPIQARLAAAAELLVKAEPAVIKTPAKIAGAPIPAFQPVKVPRAKPAYKIGDGRFVVQIGAYQNAAIAQDAWSRAVRRYQLDGSMKPHSHVVSLPGKGTFHRLSIAGFEGPAEAARLCRSIRGKGGACFVRTRAGDSLAAWATGTPRRG